MTAKHSDPVRGLTTTPKSALFEGRFGRMFRQLPAATFGKDEKENKVNLGLLGVAMSSEADPLDPKDGQDDEESAIPALYTYFGQFVDHDITFDPASSLQKQNDPNALVDFRSPALDLDNVYGRGPSDQPYMYDGDTGKFLLGAPLTGGNQGAKDLARNGQDRALIGDPRNDENSLVSQLQGLVHRFHNRYVTEHASLSFEEVQQQVRFHYQYIIVNDFLPRIVHSSVLADLKTNGVVDRKKLKWFHWKNSPFMPVEFAVAAYRIGHSMIRSGYRLNDATIRSIFPSDTDPLGLLGFKAMQTTWAIDWGRFIDIDVRDNDIKAKRLQFAYRLDTSLVNPLASLPPTVAAFPSSLAQRNLLRGWRLGLPSGQDVARAMNVQALTDDEIMIGKDTPDSELKKITDVAPVFAGNCPLWTYVLAEARHYKETVDLPVNPAKALLSPRLGPVGGRIVAEVLLGLLFGDGNSYLNMEASYVPDNNPKYALKDFVRYALG